MNRYGIKVSLKNIPELDPDFYPLQRFNDAFLADARKPIGIAVERAGGQMASVRTFIHGTAEMADADRYYIERLVKTLLWMKGGFRVLVCGDEEICAYLKNAYREGGQQAFDADFMAKVFEHTGHPEDDRVYIFFVFTVACIITLVLSYIEYRKTGKKIILKELLAGIAVGVPNYFSSFFLLSSLERLPSFLVYPIFSTGTIVLVMLVSTLLFKERPTKKQYAGIAMILLALVLLNL